MFTPPPSPFPPPPSTHNEYPSPLPIDSKLQHPKMSVSPQSPTLAEPGPSRISNDLQKRSSQRRILFTVVFIPTLLIILTLFHRCSFFSKSHPLLTAHQTAISSPVKRSPPTTGTDRSTSTSASTLSPSSSPSSGLASSPSTATSSTATPSPTSGPPSLTLPIIPDPPVLTSPLPQPFDDSTLLANFTTTSCQDFFNEFLHNPNFLQCRAFSFLLNASAGFLAAQRNVTSFNEILGATCNTPPTMETCDQRMQDFLNQLSGNCTQEISLRNHIVLQTQVSFQSYSAMRIASCLQDPAVNVYCYIEALSEGSKFGDIYLYGIPLGTPVPEGVNLSCNSCSKDVLSIYSQFVNPTGATVINTGSDTTGNSTITSIDASPLPILSMTYPNTAALAIQQCGGKFATVGLSQNSARRVQTGLNILAVSLGLVVSLWVF